MARPEQPTTSAIGRAPGTSGFTLLEVVLVLALLALLGTLTIGVSSKLLQDQATSPDDVFWKACQASRKAALESGHEVRLSFDPKAKAFICDDGATPATIPVPKAAPDLTVDFHDNQTAANLVLIAGTLVETQPIPYVTFYADGTCSPFHVQFRAKGGAHVVSIDPWTCAPILPAKPAATGS